MSTESKRIESEIELTKDSLSRHMEQIEGELHNRVERMEEKVQFAKRTVENQVIQFKQRINLKKQIEEHPAKFVAGAVLAGIVVGGSLFVRGGPRLLRARGIVGMTALNLLTGLISESLPKLGAQLKKSFEDDGAIEADPATFGYRVQ